MAKYNVPAITRTPASKRGLCVLLGNHSASKDKNAPCVCLHTLNVYAGMRGHVNTGTCVHMLTRISLLCILILLLCSPHRGAGVLQPNSPLTSGLEFALLSARVKKERRKKREWAEFAVPWALLSPL